MNESSAALQFDTAEPKEPAAGVARVRCAECGAEVTSYFDVTGRTACARCKDQAVSAQRASHVPGLLRATGLGLVGAALGAGIYYAVAEITGYEIGFISIAVGLMVGLAVKRGARGRGGWRYQALAMFLCYAAIASTYVPRVIAAMRDRRPDSAAAAPAGSPAEPAAEDAAATDGDAADAAANADAQAANAEAAAPEPVTFVGFLGALAVLVGFALSLPVLVGMESPMALVLVAIALYEAWKVNKAPPFAVSGPFAVGPERFAQDG
jgi:hypothetical protein